MKWADPGRVQESRALSSRRPVVKKPWSASVGTGSVWTHCSTSDPLGCKLLQLQQQGLSNCQHHLEVYARYLILWLY